MVLPPLGRLALRAQDHDRHRGVASHPVGQAAFDSAPQGGVAVCGHDDEVGPLGPGLGDDRLAHLAVAHQGMDHCLRQRQPAASALDDRL